MDTLISEWDKEKQQEFTCAHGSLMWLAPMVFLLGFIFLMALAAFLLASGALWSTLIPVIVVAGFCLCSLVAFIVVGFLFVILARKLEESVNLP